MLTLGGVGRAHAAATLYRLSYLNYCHLLTASQSDRDNLLASGWALEGTAGDVCGSSTDESMLVPLYRLYNSSNYDHFYTVNQDTRSSMLASGWSDQGITGYVYQSDDTGRQPLFCAYSQVNGQHQFTADRTQYNNLDSTWTREGIAAYVKTTAAPLFRADSTAGNCVITADKAENDSLVSSGSTTRGVIGFVYPIGTEESGLVPLYRVDNPYSADHYYTVSQSEYSSLVASGWSDGGIAGYLFTQTGVDHEPLYRAYNPTTGQHLFTTSAAEYNGLSASWNKEGIAAYVMYNPVPAQLTVVALGSGRMGLYWYGIPNATGYNIYRSTTPGGENYSTPVNATPVNTPSYLGSPWCTFTDTGLTDGTQYYYTVKAVYSTGMSDPSDEDSDVPSPTGIPWDSTNPATVVAAVRAYFQNLPDYPNFASAPFRVAGPDGQIYADGQSSVLLPDGLDVPGAGQVQYEDGSRTTVPQTSEDVVMTQSSQPQALEPECGPYRRVETLGAQYWGVSGRFVLPDSGCVYRASQDGGIFLYIGSSSAVGVKHPAQIDAGLIWSQPNQGPSGWKSYMLVTRPYPQNPNLTVRMHYPLKDDGLLIQPGHVADLTFEVHNQTVAKGMCVLTIKEDSNPTLMRVLVAPSGYAGEEAVRIKRLVAVAQPSKLVPKTGTYLLNVGWDFGQVLPAHAGPVWEDWYASTNPSQSGSFPLDYNIVSWDSQIDYTTESPININLQP